MSKPIKAIETRYAGCRFRSRLEARWAVFFDRMRIAWEYEPQGFETPVGRYLPDFWLPDDHIWVEVKGAVPSENELARCSQVAAEEAANGHEFLILIGDIPRAPVFDNVIGPLGIQCVAWSPVPKSAGIARLFEGRRNFVGLPDGDIPCKVIVGEVDAWRPDFFGFDDECRMFWLPSAGGGIRPALKELPGALIAARSARFEHGEKP